MENMNNRTQKQAWKRLRAGEPKTSSVLYLMNSLMVSPMKQALITRSRNCKANTISKSTRFKNLFDASVKSVKHSGIGMRLNKISYQYFEKIFQYLIASPKLEAVMFDRKKIITSKIDSTIVTLSSKLLKFGMDDNPGYKTLKFGVSLRASVPVNIMLFKGQENLSEDNALPKLILENKQKKALNIAIFDRGIQRKQNFADFHANKIFFVSRLSTQKITIIKKQQLTNTDTPTFKITKDQIIRFSSDDGMTVEGAKTEFRVITGTTKDTN